jgi:antitoxin (DNA-binding transcriptional repressor) of toxin-antitoxin stability system
MIRTTVDMAETQFRELIEAALRGEDVLITINGDDGQPAVRISRVADAPDEDRPGPKFGSARGKLTVPDDFDDPLEEFEDYR